MGIPTLHDGVTKLRMADCCRLLLENADAALTEQRLVVVVVAAIITDDDRRTAVERYKRHLAAEDIIVLGAKFNGEIRKK